MTLFEEMAVLTLAEQITAGKSFQVGMTVEVPRKGLAPIRVQATAELIERAAQVALQRHTHGYWEAAKVVSKPAAT